MSWTDGLSTRVLGAFFDRHAAQAVAGLVALLVVCFGLTFAFGGAHRVAPHWFYVPIILAGIRFGLAGALPTAVLATLLAGPLTPGDVASGTPQDASDWMVRGLFFLLVGVGGSLALRQALLLAVSDHRSQRRHRELRRALATGELELHYQAIVEVADTTIVGAEALLRWRHPTKGLILPADFIDDFEQLDEGTEWVIAEAARTVCGWKERLGMDRFHVSVNVNGHDLGRGGFASRVAAILATSGLEPRDLCLEVTESAVVEDLDHAAGTLDDLRRTGTSIAIDDLGTGHATLSYVQRLPLDVVKIDRTFVAGLSSGPRSEAIIVALIGLSRQLEVACVAEGIETEAQRALVAGHGCRHAQGFLFSRPVPADQFERLLVSQRSAPRGIVPKV